MGIPGSGRTKAGVYSFGVGRDHFKKVYLPQSKLSSDMTIPGPGTYSSGFGQFGKGSRKTRIQGRTKNVLEPVMINEKQNIPGPGSYESLGTHKLGVYTLSTI
eukprot:CAMPEP_0170487364 /NCGR_PEP_ID=MMETSP0208-20121228/6204_1 /TAXON_ID=197538 /ORGANISM="Strombidium inclinatum, Strain S3" /LENGTH=102 /DNA_ID=CAMNT_0010761625 /DNA_START=254 /DNA_END=562 /DNA_ORIENTATION=-